MQNLRNSQLVTDAKWAEITKTYNQQIGLFRTEGNNIQQGYEDLKRQQDEIALNHGGTDVNNTNILHISAGGKIITATRGTLTQLEGTSLAALLVVGGRTSYRRMKMDTYS